MKEPTIAEQAQECVAQVRDWAPPGRRFAFVCMGDERVMALVIEGDERAKRKQMPTWPTVNGTYAEQLSYACNFDVLGYTMKEINEIMVSVGYDVPPDKPAPEDGRGMH